MAQPTYASTFQSSQPTIRTPTRDYPIASTSGAAMQYGAMPHTYVASRLEGGGKPRPTTGLIYPLR